MKHIFSSMGLPTKFSTNYFLWKFGVFMHYLFIISINFSVISTVTLMLQTLVLLGIGGRFKFLTSLN